MTLNEFFDSGIVGKMIFGNLDNTFNTALMIISALVIVIAAYLLGSINFAIIISGRKYKQDIR